MDKAVFEEQDEPDKKRDASLESTLCRFDCRTYNSSGLPEQTSSSSSLADALPELIIEQKDPDSAKQALKIVEPEIQEGKRNNSDKDETQDRIVLRTLQVIKGFESVGKNIPADSVFQLPQVNGRVLSYKRFAEQFFDSPHEILSVLSSNPRDGKHKLDKHERWLQEAEKKLEDLHNEEIDRRINKLIKESKLPEGWLYKEGQDKNSWRESASKLLGLTMDLGRRISMIQNLEIPLPLPFGAKISNAQSASNISLDLPTSTDLNDPVTLSKLLKLEKWMEQSKAPFESALLAIDRTNKEPLSAIAWNDLYLPASKSKQGEYANTVAVLDKQERLLRLADPFALTLKAGETAVPVNLLQQRARVEDSENGLIKVTMEVQAQNVPWYSPQNLIYSNLGKPAAISEQTFHPNELLAVQNQNRTEFILASDLREYFQKKAAIHYGQKALFLGLDLAMLVTGSIELVAGIKGARLLLAGTESLSPLSLSKRSAKGALDLSLGLSSPLSNPYWNSFEAGQRAAHLRAMVLLGTAAAIPAQSISSLARFARRAESQAAQAGKQSLFRQKGEEALKFEALIESTGSLIGSANKYSRKVMQFGQLPLAALLSHEITEQIERLNKPAEIAVSGSRTPDLPRIASFETAKHSPDLQTSPNEHARRFAAQSFLIQESSNDNEADSGKYSRIIERSLEFLLRKSSGIESREPQEFANELAANLSFSSAEFAQLEQLNHGALNPAQIAALLNPESNRELSLSPSLRTLAKDFLARKDKSLIALSQLALISLLNRYPEIKSAEIKLAMPAKTIIGKSGGLETIKSHTIQTAIDKKVIAELVLSGIENSADKAHGLALTEALVYNSCLEATSLIPVLSRILQNPKNSQTSKLNSLHLTMAHLDPTSLSRGDFTALTELLKLTANSDQVWELRAAAASAFFRLSTKEYSKKEVAASLEADFVSKPQAKNEPSGEQDSNSIESSPGKFIGNMFAVIENEKTPVHHRASAIQTLYLLQDKMQSSQEDELRKLILTELPGALAQGRLSDSNRFIESIPVESMRNVFLQHPESFLRAALRLKELIETRLGTESEQELLAALGNFNKLLSGLSSNPKLDAAENERTESRKSTLETAYLQLARNCFAIQEHKTADLRIRLLESLAKTKKPEQAFEVLKLASKDISAMVRLRALELLNLQAAFSENVQTRNEVLALFADERDPGIVQVLEKIRTKYKRGNPESALTFNGKLEADKELAKLDSEILHRYPDLSFFDLEQQTSWADNFFPLLSQNNFQRELSETFRADRGSALAREDIQEKCKQLAMIREQQFASLQELALGDVSYPPSRWARVLLARIASRIDNAFDFDSGKVLLGEIKLRAFDEIDMLSGLNQSRKELIYFDHKSSNWVLAAEQTLRKGLEDEAGNGKDLNARLLGKLEISKQIRKNLQGD